MHGGVTQCDDLAVDFDRVWHQNPVFVHACQAFGDGCLARAAGSIEENGTLRNQRRTDGIEHRIAHHNIGEGTSQHIPIDPETRGLGPHRGRIGGERNRRWTGVTDVSRPLNCHAPPGGLSAKT
jgi:hypothetical protein